jgi:esterase
LELPSGRFRALAWGDGAETVLFLHGLTGVAEDWWPTVEALPPGRRYVAMDQRGHGQSPRAPDYSANAMAGDVCAVVDALRRRVHVVGHSMGGRVAMVAGVRYCTLVRTVIIIDVGPDASRRNMRATLRGVSARPERFSSKEEALLFGFPARQPSELEKDIFLARLARRADGSFEWRSTGDALVGCVTRQRATHYWGEWRRLGGQTLFIHGGASAEVPIAVADRMRKENPRVHFERYEATGHNIPRLVPNRLARSLHEHWTRAAASSG